MIDDIFDKYGFVGQRLLIQMSYLQTLTRDFASQITKNRKYNYSHDCLEQYLLNHPQVACSTFQVVNTRRQNIETLLLTDSNASSCIVYAHGLGSNKLEALSIAKFFIRSGYDVCSFDFSSSGRSEGEYTSYGLLEQDDVHAVLAALDSGFSYERYVLWGRSMGSAAIILSQGSSAHRKVDCMILDSPFCSFQKIAIELASKTSLIPEFMLSLLIEPLKQYFETSHPVNPFQMDILGRIEKIDSRLLIIYSKNDSVVNCSHSRELAKHCRRNPTEVEIWEDHNMQRGKSTHLKVLKFITDSQEENRRKAMLSRNKNRGISVSCRESREREHSVRSNSKIKLSICNRNPLRSHNQRSSRTIATLNDSRQYSKRLGTEIQPCPAKVLAISSMCVESNRLGANKQNVKPCLNMLRRNRFR